MITTLAQFTRELTGAAVEVVNQGRGVTAKHADRMAADAREDALQKWNDYGQGLAGAAGTIRARMSTDRSRVEGYLMADDAAVFQEHGTAHGPGQPVLGPAAERGTDRWADGLAEMAQGLIA